VFYGSDDFVIGEKHVFHGIDSFVTGEKHVFYVGDSIRTCLKRGIDTGGGFPGISERSESTWTCGCGRKIPINKEQLS
jgi:hypothetical protein